MELDPDQLRAAARRWDALAADLADTARVVRGTPPGVPGDAVPAAVGLLEAVAEAVDGLRADADRLVDGLLLTVREVVEADREVASALRRPTR